MVYTMLHIAAMQRMYSVGWKSRFGLNGGNTLQGFLRPLDCGSLDFQVIEVMNPIHLQIIAMERWQPKVA